MQLVGSHPTPSPDAPEQARRVLSALRALDSRHHLVCLISGGGSSLLELPRAGVSLEELSQTSERLMNAGADIQALNVVRRALSQLPKKQSEVVLLAHYQGLAYPEIAEVLDVPVGTVKSRNFNAMRNLLRFLRPVGKKN